MSLLCCEGKREKASEHAVVISRRLNAPAGDIVRLLPIVAGRLAGTLSLNVPNGVTLPLELILMSSPEELQWQIELRMASGATDFFEGNLRLEYLSSNETRVLLLGRFAIPRDVLEEHLSESALHEVAEEHLIRIFERMVLELESCVVVRRSSAKSGKYLASS